MSFPYTLDLSFGSEQSAVDTIGRLSFGSSEDSKDYNYKTNNFIVANYLPAPEYYYYIEFTPTSEDVKKEVYTVLNNALFSIVIANSGKASTCTIKIEYTGGEYNYLASSVVSISTSMLVPLTIPSIKSLTLNKNPFDTTQTSIATLSLHLKNALDDTDVTDSTVSASASVSPQTLIKIPV